MVLFISLVFTKESFEFKVKFYLRPINSAFIRSKRLKVPFGNSVQSCAVCMSVSSCQIIFF